MGEFLLNILSKVLVVLFMIGLIGSAIVVIITFFEDGQLLLEGDEAKGAKPEDGTVPAKARDAY